MQQRIVGFRRDEAGHWVADLGCGHSQHMRHNPPFIVRDWVESSQARASLVGTSIDCPLCDRAGARAGAPVGKPGPQD